MKKLIAFITVILIAFVAMPEISAQEIKTGESAVCFSTSMNCHECEATLTNFLKFEKGVKDLKVDLKSNTIKVVFKPGKTTPEKLAESIQKKGYEAKTITEKEYVELVGKVDKK